MESHRIGTKAPPIQLKDQDGQAIDVTEAGGKRVVLSFHPLAWTGVCQRQMEALEMNFDAFADLGAVAFGISVDAPPTKKAWGESIHVKKTRLLSDFWPHGGVATSLGLFRKQEGISERAHVILDEEGKIRFVKVYPLGDVPDMAEILDELRKLAP